MTSMHHGTASEYVDATTTLLEPHRGEVSHCDSRVEFHGPQATTFSPPPVNTPRLDTKTLTPVAAVVLFIAVVGATHFLHGRVYYPHVVVESQENVRLESLQQGLLKNEACQSAVATIADAIRASCPACRVAIRHCPGRLEPAYEKLLSEGAIEMPGSRWPEGVVTYLSDNKALALAA